MKKKIRNVSVEWKKWFFKMFGNLLCPRRCCYIPSSSLHISAQRSTSPNFCLHPHKCALTSWANNSRQLCILQECLSKRILIIKIMLCSQLNTGIIPPSQARCAGAGNAAPAPWEESPGPLQDALTASRDGKSTEPKKGKVLKNNLYF